MKKKTILLLIATFSFITSYSQGFKSKLILGANACQVDGDQNGGYNKFGPRFGFGISHPISEKIDLGFEMAFSHKGSQTKQDKDNPGLVIIRYRYNYIDLPIIATYNFSKWSAHAGITTAYLINARSDDGGGFLEMENIKKVDFLSSLGASYGLTEKLDVEARYQYSLNSVLNDRGTSSVAFRRSGAFHNVISITLNLKFN